MEESEDAEITSEPKESRVNWIIKADVECPHCGKDNDFMDEDNWYSYCQLAENVEKFNRPCEMQCKHCYKEFIVVGSDY